MVARLLVVASLFDVARSAAPSVHDAWENHYSGIGERDIEKIMQDYREDSVVERYEYSDGSLRTAKGLQEIRSFFEDVFEEQRNMTAQSAPVIEVTEGPARQTYLIWTFSASNTYNSGTDSFLFTPDNSILRQQVVSTKGARKPAYQEVKRIKQRPATELVHMDPSYAPEGVAGAWDNHFGGFGGQDLQKVMQDYTDLSELRAFDHRTGTLTVANGLSEIQGFFEDLFVALYDTSGMVAPVVHQTDEAEGKQVFLVWSCPSSGFISGTDSFFFDEKNKISRQNIVYTSAEPEEVFA
jgi:ketosteroid isomerase-like protein